MMFYTQLFTSKRGPLARIWLAAHWERKISKAHVFECNLEATIKDIISPKIGLKIGLRTSGHLLLGVVRIYSRKAKYLLADCSDAVVKIRVAFRPGQTDLPEDEMEAGFKAITLPEDFTDFESQLPDPSAIDVVDHFSLNQCRIEDITLKEDFGNRLFTVEDLGEETLSHQGGGTFDMSFHSFGLHGDDFGDEGTGFDLVDFIARSTEETLQGYMLSSSLNALPATPPPTAVEAAVEFKEPATPHSAASDREPLVDAATLNETTLLENEAEGFALDPVTVTSSSGGKKRKRKLVVDQTKELSNEAIRRQLLDCSDITAPLDMAPPTRRLAEWKETGGVDRLFQQFGTPVINPALIELFPRDVFPGRQSADRADEETDPEEMRDQLRESVSVIDSQTSGLPVEELTQLHESLAADRSGAEASSCLESNFAHTDLPHLGDRATEENKQEVSLPDPLSEDSMVVHPSGVEREIQPTQTQSVLNSQEAEERRMTSRAHNLLQALKRQSITSDDGFSLQALCERNTRLYAATTFFCFLVLKKQQVLDLHQNAPYANIIATAGPSFHQL
ncbi:double-strand-break repair protein rad21-like protein 1 [Chanos chanos]|uniref:Double-strand-break repair protein rad21-like protein 1 n=1 Tax=Chanos chanos TaxID=29144 RepID=A0A6J2WCJ0_CHACN|nr:double-strand-break repair protein rad21 homolog [Chanos chanos]